MIDWARTRVLVTGGAGFLGSFVVDRLLERGAKPENVFVPRSVEFDLTEVTAVRRLLAVAKPNVVIHLAARVGGIQANRASPAPFFRDNALMGIHLFHEAFRAGVEKILATATICAYPKLCPVPFREGDLWNGYPEETNAPYGIAKKLLTVMSRAYREQYGFNSIVIYPVNLYGPRDNFDPSSSHVIPALLLKFHEAKERELPEVTLWGDGSPTREFLYVDDCSEGIVLAIERYESSEPINLASGDEIRISDLAHRVANVVGYGGRVAWDSRQPNGQPKRRVDSSRAAALLGFTPRISLDEGIRRTYAWMRERSDSLHDAGAPARSADGRAKIGRLPGRDPMGRGCPT